MMLKCNRPLHLIKRFCYHLATNGCRCFLLHLNGVASGVQWDADDGVDVADVVVL